MYCVYSDKYVPCEETNIEHIFPLTLGGRDDFTVRVSKKFNSLVNREIDEPLAHCFLLAVDRRKNEAKGHRQREIKPPITKVTVGDDTSVIFKFNEHNLLHLYSHKNKRFITEEEIKKNGLKTKINFNRNLRARFSAKVALAAGYFIYGDTFINNVETSELRCLMNYQGEMNDDVAFNNLKLKGWLSSYPTDQKYLIEQAVYKCMAEHINRSFVAIVTRANLNDILIIVGIFGNLAGVIRCPAHSDKFPSSGEYDLGHVIILEKDFLHRLSYRSLLNEINFSFKNNNDLID